MESEKRYTVHVVPHKTIQSEHEYRCDGQLMDPKEVADRLNVLEAERDRLRGALNGLMAIVENSRGVDGWHLNGDFAEWADFVEVDYAIQVLEGGGDDN